MPGILYIVATPIGNLEDLTYRAARILGEVALIACEDTRQTRKLLEHYGIHKSLISYHEHNEASRARELVEKLASGESIALVSDAGVPLISDPGYRLVRAAIDAGISVTPIPGASAALTALSASGLATDSFRFAGFLPPKRTQRLKLLSAIKGAPETIVFYESPHRLLESLEDIEQTLGSRPIVVARELTKLHEEFLRGTASELREMLAARPSIKGEITLLIGKAAAIETANGPIAEAVAAHERSGLSRMDAIKAVARERGLSKREVYRLFTLSDDDMPDRNPPAQ
ncbi:MAG TPA: 16S rRNA (cytidine(1402)-2'-O)-methyltransferase [Bryobacteraceae bacterium]|nr:16S rRNA (cytidine(1402)-2'-O)-methyltransferase [Bryobacteraceae bacterium]